MKAQLKPVVWTVLPKMEFSTTYLFEEQVTSESSEWFQIDLKCDQGALSDSFRINVELFETQRYLTTQKIKYFKELLFKAQ